MDGIQAQWTRHNEFVESGSKGWALTRQRLMQALEGDDRVGAKNTEVDGLTIRGNKLPVRWYESPSSLIFQEREGRICTPFLPRNKFLVCGYEFPSGLIHQGHEGRNCAPFPPSLMGDLLPYIVLFDPS